MWQTDIGRQRIEVENRSFSVSDIRKLEVLSAGEKDGALRDVYMFLLEWFSPVSTIEVQTSGSTGEPKRMRVEKERMMYSAIRTCEYLGLQQGNTALLCMDMKYIGAKMMVVRALVGGLRLKVRRASGHPLKGMDCSVDFLSVVPIQLYNMLKDAKERELLNCVRHVLVGGGPVDESLQRMLSGLSCCVYSTYGMTETLSHIALRQLNGPEASVCYRPLEGVDVSLSPRGTLVIHAPQICATDLETNDVVHLYPNGMFTVVGRADNTVNSGGIKIQIEEEERRLRSCITVPFALTSVPDTRLGEALVLLVVSDLSIDDTSLFRKMKTILDCYHVPRYIVRVEAVPLTGNGKIDRKACRELAFRTCGE